MPQATSSAFLTNLRRPNVGLCLCWKLTLLDGTVQRYTNHDKPLTYGADLYKQTGAFNASALTNRDGLSVDNLTITAITTNDIPEEELLAGKYDGAMISIYLAQWTDTSAGLMPLKRGFLGEVTWKGASFDVEVRGLAETLQRATGRVYTLECNANLGDARCKVDLTPYTFTTTISALDDGRSFGVALASQPEGYFQYGTCEFLTGANAGAKVEVLGHQVLGGVSWITLLEVLPLTIAYGDEVKLVRGCDHLLTTCKLFGNVPNFRGFPNMPTELQALETPNAK